MKTDALVLATVLTTLTASGCDSQQDIDLAKGKAIVEKNCLVCHGQGINGAPIIGNQTMWAPRITQGESVLIEHASNGYQMMPARGGNLDLSDAEISLAVRYILSQLPR